MFVGLFTPTEAGAVGAIGAFLIALITRKITWATFKQSLFDTARLCAMLFLIVAGMLVFMRFLTLSGLTIAVTDFIMGLPVGPTVTLIVVLLVGTVYGFFLSPMGVLMLIVPIFAPIMVTLGINPIHFGILIVRVTEIAMIIPPIGVCVYAVKSVVPDVPIEDIFKGALPFLLVDFINLAMLIFIPQIILFLPSLMF
jgi:TRAP-type C4-dicarboxylate transport system permease large subunit